MTQEYEEASRRLTEGKRVIALTGAGASVESGIPDFRSEGGIWSKYPPYEYATIDAFVRNPEKVWSLWFDLGAMMEGVKPNPGHYALAELERLGHLHAVITQNIDNLHQEAGSTNVIEYHGNTKRIVCLRCHTERPLDIAKEQRPGPRCACGEFMKPDVVLFGEAIPHRALLESEALAQSCDVILIVGTSAQVFPAAGLPFTAKDAGAYVIECNVEPTEFTRTITDAFLRGPSGETLPRLVNWVRR